MWYPTSREIRARCPDFLYAASPIAPCATFYKESRMKLVHSARPHRKSGVWGTRRLVAQWTPALTAQWTRRSVVQWTVWLVFKNYYKGLFEATYNCLARNVNSFQLRRLPHRRYVLPDALVSSLCSRRRPAVPAAQPYPHRTLDPLRGVCRLISAVRPSLLLTAPWAKEEFHVPPS